MSEIQKRVLQGETFSTLIVPDAENCSGEYGIVLEARAKADIVVLLLPGVSASQKFRISMEGAGADCNLSGIYLCPENENAVIDVELIHRVGGCSSHQLFKGIVSGSAKVDFYGKIIVDHNAQKTEAYQENHSLLLSDGAKVNTRPQLEIYADDVKCNHGATIGKLNEDEQFYMRSRGISIEEAKVLQMISFLSPVFEHVGDIKEREVLKTKVEDSIRHNIMHR